jgi:hypothetical protein
MPKAKLNTPWNRFWLLVSLSWMGVRLYQASTVDVPPYPTEPLTPLKPMSVDSTAQEFKKAAEGSARLSTLLRADMAAIDSHRAAVRAIQLDIGIGFSGSSAVSFGTASIWVFAESLSRPRRLPQPNGVDYIAD